MGSLLAAAALAVPVLAGCTTSPVQLSQAQLAPEMPSFLYLCPGAARPPSPEPCLGRLARDDATLQEPYAALHPGDPDVMAIGVNLGPPFTEHARGSHDLCRLEVYVTEDGGRAWRAGTVPPPAFTLPFAGAAAGQCSGDPALVFDEAGTLHASGLANAGTAPAGLPLPGREGGGFAAYYARSDDLGRTWGEPVVVGPNGQNQDRNWLARDPASGALYVNWQNVAGGEADWTTEVAWSLDGGATWRNQEPHQRPVCRTPGPVTLAGGVPLVSCVKPGDPDRVRVYAFDPASGGLALRGGFEAEATWPLLVALADGRLAAVYRASEGGLVSGDSLVRFSGDAGRTWSDALSTRELAEGPWDLARAYWAAADPFGGLHMMVRVGRLEAPMDDAGRAREGTGAVRYELRHLALDAAGRKAHEVALEAWSAASPPAVRPAQGLGDHYYAIAWSGDEALLAYTRDGAIKLTLATPAPGHPGP